VYQSRDILRRFSLLPKGNHFPRKCFQVGLELFTREICKMGTSEPSKILLSGNEAIARGALEAGIGFCASYPGTPSTEIATTIMQHAEDHDIYTEWSVNEKVALEASAGASWAGVPALCSMKSLGLNVASDFLLNLNLSGSGPGGLVIVVCDDPYGHSSSNEQDSRFYARAAYLPLIEPSDFQQAKDVIPYAFDISQRYQIPVIVRSTTRLSHSRGVVVTGSIPSRKWKVNQNIPTDLFNVPNPHRRHRDLIGEKRSSIASEFDKTVYNTIKKTENADSLIITSGICGKYALDALSILNDSTFDVASLVTTSPIPLHTILSWVSEKEHVLFMEEVDPFIEDEILALASELEWKSKTYYGKRDGTIPLWGELNTDIAIEAISKITKTKLQSAPDQHDEEIRTKAKSLLIPRPLTFCAGCTHRNVYWAINKLRQKHKDNIIVAGDIGCYSLGVFYDHSMDTMQAMGSGIGTANGLGQLHRFGSDKKVIAVAGDSTFFHACIPGLVNARHKNADLTFVILDNATTAMTGFQQHPGSKKNQDTSTPVSIKKIVEAIEPDMFETVNAEDINATIETLDRAVSSKGLKVILADSICRLEKGISDKEIGSPVKVVEEECRGEKCRICVSSFACPALEWDEKSGKARVVEYACIRCGACIDVCPHGTIVRG